MISIKFGTAISKVATPIAGALGMDCYDQTTHGLRPESPCAKTARALDERRWRDAFVTRFPIFEQFWSTQTITERDSTMKEYGVQCVVKAENLKELEEKLADIEILAVQVRPPKPAPGVIPGRPQTPLPQQQR